MKRTYTWDFKAEVLAVYEVDGPTAAAKLYEMPKRTLCTWAADHGISTSAETKRQTEAALDLLNARRLRIRDKLAERAEEMLDRMGEASKTWVGSGATPIEVDLDRPIASVCRDLATTAGILIDKFRLEAGEPTERIEHNDVAKDARERLASRIASIAAAKRAEQAAADTE